MGKLPSLAAGKGTCTQYHTKTFAHGKWRGLQSDKRDKREQVCFTSQTHRMHEADGNKDKSAKL